MLLVALSHGTGRSSCSRFAYAFLSTNSKGSNLGRSSYTYSLREQLHSSRYRLFSTASNETNEKARVLFLGTPDVAATSLGKIVEASKIEGSPFEVVAVVTQPPKRRKRRGKEIPSPVGLRAEDLDIPILCPEKAKDPAFLDELENEIKPDLCITAGKNIVFLPRN